MTSTQWITSAYLLALAGALPASGWLSRRLGAGRLWLWSLGGFTITSGLCALAPSIDLLVGCRVAQGIAGGLLVSAGITVLAQVAGPGGMGRILAITGVPTVLAPALGPTVGALLIAHLSWPWLFVINLPIGAAAVFLGLGCVPRGERVATTPIDLPGLALVGAGLPLLTYGITGAAEEQSAVAPTVWYPCSPAAPPSRLRPPVAAAKVAAAEPASAHQPGLHRRRLSDCLWWGRALRRPDRDALVLPATTDPADRRHRPAILALRSRCGRHVPPRWTAPDRHGGGRVAAVGLAVTAAVTVPMALIGPDASLVGVEVLQVLRGIGLALAGAPVVAAAMSAVVKSQLADASAMINISSRVGGALGSALLVVILTNNLPHAAAGSATAAAFHTTFWWLSLAAVAALAVAGWLVVEQRRARTGCSLSKTVLLDS